MDWFDWQKLPLDWQKLVVFIAVLILAAGSVYFLYSAAQPETMLYVPSTDLRAYYRITATDLMTTTLPTADLPSNSVINESDLVDRYSSQSLTTEKPVTAEQLVPTVNEKYVLDTTAVSIPATASMAYNGQLASGTIVTVWTVTDAGNAEPLLDEVLVLDVQKVEEQTGTEGNSFPYVIVLAVPGPEREALLSAVAKDALYVTLTP